MESYTNAITEIREKTGLSRAAFCRYYDIPKRTCENWESGVRVPPEYIVKLLRRAIEEDFKEHITATDCTKIVPKPKKSQ